MSRSRHTTRKAFYSSFFIFHFSFLKAIYSSFFILHSSFFLSCSPGAGEEGLVLLFTGDVLLDRGVRPIAEREGVPYLFEGVADDFARADAVIVNLECPLADTLSPLGKQYVFHAPTRYAAGLRQAGITHACLANNHTNDQSRRGLRSTARALRDAGITPLGYGTSAAVRTQPTLIRKNGVTAALFNSVALPLENWVPSDSLPDVCQLRAEALAAVIHAYKAVHPDHYAIAVLHWGVEFQQSPSMRQRLGAAALASAGCDAVIGHHPHVVQEMSELETNVSVPVFYSLGNFVFDQTPPSTRRAVMAELVLTPDTLKARAIPVTLRHCRPVRRK